MKLDKKKAATKIQEFLIDISLQTVGRSIPLNFYEVPIPNEVMEKIKKIIKEK